MKNETDVAQVDPRQLPTDSFTDSNLVRIELVKGASGGYGRGYDAEAPPLAVAMPGPGRWHSADARKTKPRVPKKGRRPETTVQTKGSDAHGAA
ncbi:MAG TPA: hypothetical protein VIS09_00570 [Streptomyces sp.]